MNFVVHPIYIFRQVVPVFSTKYYFLFENFTVKEFINFSFYSFLTSIGFLLAFKIDSLMIPNFLNMEENGAYNLAIVISSIIGIPMAGFFIINSHIVSKLIKDENIKELEINYKESAVFLYWIGSIFFFLILLILPFFEIYLNNYSNVSQLKIITILLSISVLINMGTSYNTEIINYSKHYKVNLYSLLILVISNIILNLYFLTQTNYKLIGVAIASLISMVLYNTFKIVFIYRKFKITPFDIKYLKVFIISSSFYILIFILPEFNSKLFTFSYKFIIILFLYTFLVYKFKLIETINKKIISYLN